MLSLCWAWLVFSQALAVLADSTRTSTGPTRTSTSAAPKCTADLIKRLCDYPDPLDGTAVASNGKSTCWEYCNGHQPCSFVIFVLGNPHTGVGTCWLYPGESFDESKGNTNCANPWLYVFDKPVCSGSGTATSTSGACAATETPSAIASVCGYPTPPDDCFESCSASDGASDCLSQCAKANACSYVVFNANNEDSSPYLGGTCWIYPNGTYSAKSTTPCKGDPKQFVYENKCPKPSRTSSSRSSSSATDRPQVTANANEEPDSTTTSQNSAPTDTCYGSPLALGMVMLLWQGL